jgi:hypothetical protein
VVEPSTPRYLVFLLAFYCVGQEYAGEFTSTLLAKVQVGDRDSTTEADVTVAKEEGSHEARYEESLEDIARLELPLRDVAPAFGIRQVIGRVDLWNPAVLFDSPPRIELPIRRLRHRRCTDDRDRCEIKN